MLWKRPQLQVKLQSGPARVCVRESGFLHFEKLHLHNATLAHLSVLKPLGGDVRVTRAQPLMREASRAPQVCQLDAEALCFLTPPLDNY